MQALFHAIPSPLNALVVAFLGIAACTVIVVLFLRRLDSKVDEVVQDQDDVEGRVIGLEVKEYSQDERLEYHQKMLNNHARFMVKVRRDVDGLGRDVGWDDSRQATEELPVEKKPKE